MRNALSRLSSNFTICIISHGFLAFSLFSTIFLYLSILLDNGIIQNIPVSDLEAIIMRSVSCIISFKIWIRRVRKKFIFYNIESRLFHYLVLIIMYIEKSSALRRRTKLSTQPLIYRILVSGKLSLYIYSNEYKEKSQDGFPLLFYADSSSNIPAFLIHPMNQYIYHYTC